MTNKKNNSNGKRFPLRVVALEERDYVSGRLPTEIWEITAEEWRSLRAAAI